MNVKFVKLSCGDEFVADVEEVSISAVSPAVDYINCKNPVIFTPTDQGMGIMNYPVFGKKNGEVRINKQYVVYMVDLQENLENAYKKQFGGIIEAKGLLI